MKKEELIKENGALRTANDIHASKEANIRQEFAKAFGWGKRTNSMYSQSEWEYENPSWEQIFVKVGKLILRAEDKKNLEEFERINNENYALKIELDELRKKSK